MADELDNISELPNGDTGKLGDEESKSSETDQLFKQFSVIEPPRDVVVPDEGNGKGEVGHEDLEDRIEGSPRLSDVQSVLKQLFVDLGIPWLNNLQMARIPPEYYNYLKRIIVKRLIRRYKKEPAEAIAIAEVAVGVAIDGDGRIEAIAVMGRAAEAEETKNKSMGMP